MDEFQKMHIKLLDFNTNISYLKPLVSEPQIDYTKVKFFHQLGDLLPERSVFINLATWPIISYFFSALCCLGCSTVFHWFYPMNNKLYGILHRLDLSAVCILIFGSLSSMIYYTFYCNLAEWIVWIVLNSISCFGTFIISMFEWFHQEKYVKIRGGVFAICGIFAGCVQINIGLQSYYQGTD